MDIAIYIKGTRLDLFDDEKISINLSVKNISDISKLMADFTQTFSVPASPTNNKAFSHWYDSDVDGEFTANKRIEAYIEVNTLPFRFGSVQLMKAIKKNGMPSSYSITFFGKSVNLSDLMGDYKLSDLDLSEFDHEYTETIVITAMHENSIGGGDIYYPLISSENEMSLGTDDDRDLLNEDNLISWREFKPAIREIKIIEAIELFTGISFSRDFFGRSIFWNKFLWLHREAGKIKAFGSVIVVDIIDEGTLATVQVGVDTINNSISYTPQLGNVTRRTRFKVTPQAGFETATYKMSIFNNGIMVVEKEGTGIQTLPLGVVPNDVNLTFFVTASDFFEFESTITVVLLSAGSVTSGFTETPVQFDTAYLRINQQMPDIKIKDYFNSLVSEFNLILNPVTETTFTVDTLDNWYSKGLAHDITDLVDIDDIQVSRVDVKKQISFKYKPAGTILAKTYATNNNVGYGDLEATFEDIAGNDLKIESQFENMLFERLPNEATGDLSDLQAGYAIDAELKPYKGAPISLYKNGYTYTENPIYISGNALTKIFHTATEDNIQLNQVTNSLNFGSDISSYFYSPIEQSLYANNYRNQTNDLFNSKARLYDLKTLLPIRILQSLSLNDRFIIGDKKYKISNVNIDLTDGQSTIQIYNDFSPPIDSSDNTTLLTVDSTLYTVDTTELTADMVSIHTPIISFIINGISRNEYIATASQEFFEVYVSANTNWIATNVDTGDGVSWFSASVVSGVKSNYSRITVDRLGTIEPSRSGIIRFTIGGFTYDLTIYQNQQL